MCGIVGYVNLDGRAADRALLGRMNEAIHHRGPDEDGFYVKEHVGLAMRRLAIIDLKGGQQPIAHEEGTAWIVYNGEVYNYREVKKELEGRGHRFHTDCDTEVVLHAYLEYGSVGREVDRGAIHDYLSFMCVPAPLTAFKDVRKLEPGHSLTLTADGEVKTERYWEPDFNKKLK